MVKLVVQLFVSHPISMLEKFERVRFVINPEDNIAAYA